MGKRYLYLLGKVSLSDGKGTYIRQGKVPIISDWKRYLCQTRKDTYIKLGKIPISDRKISLYQTKQGTYGYIRMRKVTLKDWERYPYQTEKGTYIKQENVLISD